MEAKNITFTFRWPVAQVDANVIEMQVPKGPNGIALLNPHAVEEFRLSEKEIASAEAAVIQAIAIIH